MNNFFLGCFLCFYTSVWNLSIKLFELGYYLLGSEEINHYIYQLNDRFSVRSWKAGVVKQEETIDINCNDDGKNLTIVE